MIREHPVMILLALQLTLFAGAAMVLRTSIGARIWPIARGITLVLLIVPALLLAYSILRWFSYPTFTDHAEPTVAATAYLFYSGVPLYSDLDSGAIYSNNYGPTSYWLPYITYWLLGPSVLSAKLYGLACLAGTLLAFALAMARVHGRQWAAIAVLLMIGYFLRFEHISFWVRPDPFIIFLVTAGLLCTTFASQSPRITAVLLGFLAGITVASKVHGAIYFLPLFLMHPFARSIPSFLLWAALPLTGAVVVAFLAGNISLSNYLDWIRLTSQQGLSLDLGARVLEEMIWLTLPCITLLLLAARGRWHDPDVRYQIRVVCGLIAAMFLIGIPASKHGSGAHHLLPFVPVILFCMASSLSLKSLSGQTSLEAARIVPCALAFATVVALVSVSLAKTYEFTLRMNDGQAMSDALTELRAIAQSNPEATMALSYGDIGYMLTYLRVDLVFRGQPYPFDAASVAELRLAGRELPDASQRLIESGQISVYLFPKGSVPFGVRSPYSEDGSIGMGVERPQLFPDSLMRSFRQHYTLKHSGTYFDIWQYQPSR